MKTLPRDIFFDLGNVIIPIDFSRNWDYFLTLGADRGQLEEHWSLESFHPMFEEYESGRITTDILRIKFQEIFLQRREISLSQFEEGLAALLLPIPPRRIAFVDTLRKQGFRCHVISNNTELHTRLIRQNFKENFGRAIEDCFDNVFLSQEVNCRKPEIQIYELALAKAGAIAFHSLMIDDLPINLAGAVKAGMQTLLVTHDDEVEERIKEHYTW